MVNGEEDKTVALSDFISKWLEENVAAYAEDPESPEGLAAKIANLLGLKEEAPAYTLEEPIKRRGQGE